MSPSPARQSLLVVDDDGEVVSYLVEMLNDAGYDAEGLTSPARALERIVERDVDLVIADIEMPEMRGTEFLAAALRRRPQQLVILITAFGSIDLAVQAVRAGACDFVTKPFKIEALYVAIERALRERQMRREIVRLRSRLPGIAPGELVAKSAAMQRVLALARRAAGTDLTILVTGESGTGKGAVARFIHDKSDRHARPFVAVNCAALPANLIESELFGVHRGAFTDAKESRPGLFVEADGGTLFLDEIGELPIESQAKLLAVLESGRVRALGKTTEVSVDVRVVAATNRPLEDALRARQFRPDLYYRLNILRFDVPPLRERPEDILGLVDVFLHRASQRGGREVLGLSAAAMRVLLEHSWPGNVRELMNAVERAVALTDHDTLLPEDFSFCSSSASSSSPAPSSADQALPLAAVERSHIQRVLETTGGNKVRAARILGIDRRTLQRKLGALLARGEPLT